MHPTDSTVTETASLQLSFHLINFDSGRRHFYSARRPVFAWSKGRQMRKTWQVEIQKPSMETLIFHVPS
jgi:hypothetical protein